MDNNQNEKKEFVCTSCGSKSENTAGTCCGGERATVCSKCQASVKAGEQHACKSM